MKLGSSELKVFVIGGGIAGLVSACMLSALGFSVTLFEKQKQLGGRWREIRLGNYRFDLSPPFFYFPDVFTKVFQISKKNMRKALQFHVLDVCARNFFAKGSMLDLTNDPESLRNQFEQFSPEDYEGFIRYIETTHKIFQRIRKYYRINPTIDGKHRLWSPSFLWLWSSVYPFQTLDQFHHQFFNDPRLISLLNRTASVVGSSPYQAPAYLSVIAYLQLVQGAQMIRGGNHQLVPALAKLAEELGVSIRTNCPIDEITLHNQKVTGVRIGRKHYQAHLVVSSVDFRTTHDKLLTTNHHRPISTPSYSEFVCLFGVKKKFPHLHHHNFFFPKDYGREFIDMIEQQEWSLSPCIYVGYSGFTNPKDTTVEGSNLLVRVNVPHIIGEQSEADLEKQYQYYRDSILYWLEKQWAFSGITQALEVEKLYGPKEWEEMTGAWRGSLYGNIFHGKHGFFRPALRDPKITGLYYVGATTFPGGGGDFSAMSGIEVSNCIQQDLKKASYT